MVPASLMCRRHLLGEHVEIHMLLGTLLKGRSIAGFLDKGLLEPVSLKQRHDLLAVEMEARGYRHGSPISSAEFKAALASLDDKELAVKVDPGKSRMELYSRCAECENRN